MLFLGLALLLLFPHIVAAQTVKVVSQFIPQAGQISDAALLENGHLALLYPAAGQIADYTLNGTLYQHVVRESGAASRFTPTFCATGPKGNLLVFDEAAHKLFTISADGNFMRGVDLAMPAGAGGEALALSRIGGLTVDSGGLSWALLPERGSLAGFDGEGLFKRSIDFAGLLPYAGALYTRAQWLDDGSLFVLDYHQGAVLYRKAGEEHFHRVKLPTPAGLDSAPLTQDFAVDQAGNIMLASAAEGAPLLLLTLGAKGYESHPVELKLPNGAERLACRHSQGRFILWSRDEPFVCVLELH